MNNTVEAALFAVFWSATLALALLGTIDGDVRVMFWAVMLGMISSIGTGHMIVNHAVRRERARVETLVEHLATSARLNNGEVPRLVKR